MIARTTRTICELLAASLLGAMLLMGIAGWRLAKGPVPLDFLTPHLVRALNGQGTPFRVTIETTNLAWAGWDRRLDIRVGGVHAVGEDGQVVAHVPQMAVGISLRGLLRGIVAPTGIDVIGATLRVGREKTGAFTMALGESGNETEKANPEVMNRLIAAVQSEPDPARPVTYLKRMRVLNAKLVVDDRLAGVTWVASQADVVLFKERGELRGTYFAKLDFGGSIARLNGAASWRPNSDVIRIDSAFSGVRINRIAAKLPQLNALDALRFDVQGRAAVTLSTDGLLRQADFELTAGKGQIAYAKLWPEGMPIESANLRGRFDGETQRLEIDRIAADIGGPLLSGRGAVIRLSDGLAIDGRLGVDKMPLSRLGKYWPRSVSGRTRDWVVRNMPAGEVLDTDVALSLRLDKPANGRVSLESMSGTLKLKDTTIHHLDGLPPVKDVAASAVFTRDSFIARIRHGKSAGLTVTAAEVRLTELQGNEERAQIDVAVEGSLADALSLIDSPRLGFASRFGLRPDSVSGETTTQLQFKFPVLRDLPLDVVDIQTVSHLRDPRVPNLAFGRTVSAKTLLLKVDKQRLELSGQAKIGEVGAAVKWTELFHSNEKFPRRYEVRTVLDHAQRDAFGLADLSPFLEGPLGADIAVLQPRAGPSEIVLKLALKDAKLWIPGFRWRKPAGREGIAWFRLLLDPDGKLSIPEFDVGSPGLTAKGSMEFDRQRKFTRMEVGKFNLGRTDLTARVATMPDGRLDVDIGGSSLDASTFLDPGDLVNPGDTAPTDAETLPPLTMQVNIDRVWFSGKAPVDRLTGGLQRDGESWRKVTLSGLVGEDQKVTFVYDGVTDAERIVVRSDNAGNALRALDLMESIKGGTMTLAAKRPGRGKDIPWKGSLTMTDFVLVNAPVIAKVLTIASFTGIGDTLAGRGIRFAKLEAPFEFRDGVAAISNARTVGAELGFTAEGDVDTKSQRIKVSGTIVPAYTLNSVLGKIPILGTLITGKNNSGIFAATYRIDGPLEQPEISVNPLAALAPGFLRNLIGIFDGSLKADPDSGTIENEQD